MKQKLNKRFNNHKYQHSAGFTLIELLVVVSIITFIASIITTTTVSARVKARDTVRLQNRKLVIDALNLYVSDNNGAWPDSQGVFKCIAPSSETCWYANPPPGGPGSNSGLDSLVSDLSPYLKVLPTNNAEPGKVAYNRMLYQYSGTTIRIWWFVENPNNTSGCPGDDGFYYWDGKYYACREIINR